MKTRKNNNLLFGFSAGFLLMLIIGWIPVLGPLLSGLVAGLITKRGTLYGLFSGFLSSLVASIIMLFVVIDIFRSTYLVYLLSLFDINLSSLIILIGIISVLISAIGGYIGGAIRPYKTHYK